MWTGMMLLGFLAVFGLPDLSSGADDESDDTDRPDDDLPDGPDPVEELGAEPGDVPESADNGIYAGGKPGITMIEGFQPGSDTLTLRVPSDVTEIAMTDGQDGEPASLSYVSADDTTEIRFDGLETVPVDDIGVLLDGDGDPMALGDFLSGAEEDDALAPEDGDDPTVPDDAGDADAGLAPEDGEDPTEPDDSGDADAGLPPDEGDAPTEPGEDDDDGTVLLPDDGTVPTGASGPSDLTALMERDGADATGQTDAPGTVASFGDEDDLVIQPDDGLDGNGEGVLVLSEAAMVTGGEVIDLGAGDDTFVAGDGAVHAFGGEGDDNMTAGDGAGALYGGDGNDVMTGEGGEGGTDLLHGGSGDDSIAGGAGGEYLDGGEHAEVEASGNDTIAGGDGDDTIRGGWGADSLSGGDGDDIIDHHGSDELRTVAEEWHHEWHEDGAADTLDGGTGDDTLVMSSDDEATGGAGEDVFWIYPEGAGSGAAVITDFEPGEDFLRITLEPGAAGEVDVVPSEDGADMLVQIGGQTVAVLQGATGASTSDLYVEVKDEIYA